MPSCQRPLSLASQARPRAARNLGGMAGSSPAQANGTAGKSRGGGRGEGGHLSRAGEISTPGSRRPLGPPPGITYPFGGWERFISRRPMNW